MDDIISIWKKTLSIIKSDIIPVSFDTWIEPVIPVSMTDDSIILQVPYEYNKTMIEERYGELIKNALLYITGNSYELDVRIRDEKKEEEPEKPYKNSTYYGLNPFYTFDNFVTGDSNQVAYAFVKAASKACVEGTYIDSNPVFIFGDAGLGKTHLSLAIANVVIERGYGVYYGSIQSIIEKGGLLASLRG